MFHFFKSYAVPNTFPSNATNQRDLECVEMGQAPPFFAASVEMEDGEIRWLLLAGPSALARAHEGLADGATALAVYQIEPSFEDGIELRVRRVAAWDSVVRVVIDDQSPQVAYRITGLIPVDS